MTPNIILNEIMTSQWMMSRDGFFQLATVIKSITEGNFKDKPKVDAINALTFFNEDQVRIYPRSVAEIPEGTIAKVNLIGPIMRYGSWWVLGADEIVSQLVFADNTPNIIGTLLYVNGPGGTVNSINPFKDFAKTKKKPIIGLMDASLSMHRWIPDVVCDYQMADNTITSRFGSIGVVASWMDATKYYEDLGIKIEEVYPDESKHKNEIWRTMKKNPKKGKEMLKKMQLSPLAIAFQNDVKKAHPNLLKEEGVLTGRTFTAEDAVRIGMINSIGTITDAINKLKMMAEMSSINN